MERKWSSWFLIFTRLSFCISSIDYCDNGVHFAQEGNWNQAIPLLEQCSLLSLNPKDGWNTGVAYSVIDDRESTFTWMTWTILRNPFDITFVDGYLKTSRNHGYLKEAVLFLELSLSHQLKLFQNNENIIIKEVEEEEEEDSIVITNIRNIFESLGLQKNEKQMIDILARFQQYSNLISFDILTKLLISYLTLFRESISSLPSCLLISRLDIVLNKNNQDFKFFKQFQMHFHQNNNHLLSNRENINQGIFSILLEIIVILAPSSKKINLNDNDMIFISKLELFSEELFTFGRIDYGMQIEFLINEIKLPNLSKDKHQDRLVLSLTAGLDAHLLRLVRSALQFQVAINHRQRSSTTIQQNGIDQDEAKLKIEVEEDFEECEELPNKPLYQIHLPLACPLSCGHVSPQNQNSTYISSHQINQVLSCCLKSQNILTFLISKIRLKSLNDIYKNNNHNIINNNHDIYHDDDNKDDNENEYYIINKKNTYGWTPLLLSSLRNNIYLFNELITRGAEVEMKNNDKFTFLHVAVCRFSLHVLTFSSFAIQNEMFLKIQNINHQTAFVMICEHHHHHYHRHYHHQATNDLLIMIRHKNEECSPRTIITNNIIHKQIKHEKGVLKNKNSNKVNNGGKHKVNELINHSNSKISNEEEKVEEEEKEEVGSFCSFHVIDANDLTYEIFMHKFVGSSLPLLIKNALASPSSKHHDGSSDDNVMDVDGNECRNDGEWGGWFSPKRWSLSNLMAKFGDMVVEIGEIPYASSFGLTTKKTYLKLYISFINGKLSKLASSSSDSFDTENEATKQPCLFQSVQLHHHQQNDSKEDNEGDKEGGGGGITQGFQLHHSSPLFPIVDSIVNPSSSLHVDQQKIQMFLGLPNSGAPMHFHKSALNFLIYGKKKWYLINPQQSFFSIEHPLDVLHKQHYKGDDESNNDAYSNAMECVQESGDVLYVPDMWGHAVLNQELSFGFALEFETGVSALY